MESHTDCAQLSLVIKLEGLIFLGERTCSKGHAGQSEAVTTSMRKD